jgi:hypothetical protein
LRPFQSAVSSILPANDNNDDVDANKVNERLQCFKITDVNNNDDDRSTMMMMVMMLLLLMMMVLVYVMMVTTTMMMMTTRMTIMIIRPSDDYQTMAAKRVDHANIAWREALYKSNIIQ